MADGSCPATNQRLWEDRNRAVPGSIYSQESPRQLIRRCNTRVACLPLSRNEFWFSGRVLFAQPVAWLVMRTGILSCFGMCVGLFRALLPSWFWWFGQEFLAGPSVLALGWGPAARVLRFRQFEGELESTTYRPRVRGNRWSIDNLAAFQEGLSPRRRAYSVLRDRSQRHPPDRWAFLGGTRWSTSRSPGTST